jgi:hypothetical protein
MGINENPRFETRPCIYNAMLFVILIIGGAMLFLFLISEGKIVTFQHVVKRVF